MPPIWSKIKARGLAMTIISLWVEMRLSLRAESEPHLWGLDSWHAHRYNAPNGDNAG